MAKKKNSTEEADVATVDVDSRTQFADGEKADYRGMMTFPPTKADLVLIPVELIDDRHNLRQSEDKLFIEQLSESIKNIGLMEPLIVRKLSTVAAGGGKKYRLVAGHQRLAAAKLAGQEEVEAKVFQGVDDVWEAKARLAENVQRKDLTHIDLALVFAQAQKAGLTVSQIAGQSNLSDDTVRRHLWLVNLAEPVRQLVASGKLPVHQAELISHVGEFQGQIELVALCLDIYWDKKKKIWQFDKGKWGQPANGDGRDFCMPMGQLRREVERKLCGLAACGWLKVEAGADGDDYGFAGQRPCIGCPDNTATYAGQPTLFDGLRPQGSPKKGHCTNQACYDAKTAAWAEIAERKKAAEKKELAKKIQKARKSGLVFCEECGKILPDDVEQVKGVEGEVLCKKCADKLQRQAARGGGERKARPFPQSPEEKHAVNLAAYGTGVLNTIGKWAKGEEKRVSEKEFLFRMADLLALGAALAQSGDSCRPTGVRIELVFDLKIFPTVEHIRDRLSGNEDLSLPPGVLPGLADMSFPNYPEYYSWENKAINVPLPEKSLKFLECIEEFCKKYSIKIPNRPAAPAVAVETAIPDKPPGQAAAPEKKKTGRRGMIK